MNEIKSAGQRVTINKSARMLPVTARAVIGPTTPVMKIDGRLLPVSTIRGGIRKDVVVPTFGAVQASQEITTWLPGALDALAQVIAAAIEGVPPELQSSVTPEIRIQAVRNSATQFADQLVEMASKAIVGTTVSKRRAGSWKGQM